MNRRDRMEFTVSSGEELAEELSKEGYSDSEIDTIVSLFEEEEDGTETTITVADPQ